MTYSEFKTANENINNKVDSLSDIINSFDWRNEKIRMSEEFQAIKKQWNKAFKELQNFNKAADKSFQRKLRLEKRKY
jgi:hypothetical protein